MSVSNYKKYDIHFKKYLVNLYLDGKSPAALCEEYFVSKTALYRWIKQYSEIDNDLQKIIEDKQLKELQRQKAILEEEMRILTKAIALFTS